ncbi:hypothetical protein [Streptomyces cellulosae]|uniref:Uncharacterized protein n=1 Tax=Streptomyces cellulosae TaxID=1968 RepID=A0ABW7YIH8_STRCE
MEVAVDVARDAAGRWRHPARPHRVAWYEAQDLARTADLATLKNALIKHTEAALDRAARIYGKRVRDFSDEQKTVCFAAAALAIEDLSPSLAHRLLGPLRLALGDVYTYPVPSWADSL